MALPRFYRNPTPFNSLPISPNPHQNPARDGESSSAGMAEMESVVTPLNSSIKGPSYSKDTILKVAMFLGGMAIQYQTNPPDYHLHKTFVYAAYMSSLYLTLFISLGLFLHLIYSPSSSSEKIGWIHTNLILIGFGSLLITSLLRTCIFVPMRLLGFVCLLLLSATVVITIYMVIAWKYKGSVRTHFPNSASPSSSRMVLLQELSCTETKDGDGKNVEGDHVKGERAKEASAFQHELDQVLSESARGRR